MISLDTNYDIANERGTLIKHIFLCGAIAILLGSPLIPQTPPQPAPGASQPPALPPGRISGYVFVEGTTKPIAGVAISVAIPAGPRGRGASGEPIPGLDPLDFTAKTDGSGRFSIDNVPAGNRSIMAQLEGYFAPNLNGNYLNNARATVNVVSRQTAEVKIGMTPGGAIGGHVYDSDGAPVSDTQVQALRLIYYDGQPTLQQTNSKSTDDHGEYRIYRLPPGDYYLSATPRQGSGPRGNVAATLPVRTYYPDTADPSRAIATTVHGGEEISGANISIRNEVAATLSGQILTTLPASGQIVGPRGGARGFTVMNSTLTLGPHDKNSLTTLFNTTTTVSMMGPDAGKFQIRNVPPGIYDLMASLPDATGWGPQAPIGQATQPVGYGRTVVEVRGGNVEGITVNVHAGVDVKGRISVNGGTQYAQNVRLTLRTDDGAQRLPVYQQVSQYQPVVDENGNFIIPSVPEGQYRIQVTYADGPVNDNGRGARGRGRGQPAQQAPAVAQRGRGPAPLNEGTAYVQDIRQGSVSVYDNGITVGAQSAGDLDVLIGMGPGTIQGSLLDPSQKPLPSTLVFLVPASNRRNNMALYRTASSDPNGKFSFGGIVPGQYELYAWQNVIQGAYQNAEYLRKYQGRGTVVTVMQAATVMTQVHVIPAEQR